MSASSSSLSADSFSPLLPILNAFNHRHHNQHRLAHWWPVFRTLRRTVRNLIDDLSPPSTSLSSRPTPRREASSIPPRAVWLHKHFISRAYVAFSQLAADNQHAPLGLLLLAILARIHTAISPYFSTDNCSTPKPQPKTNRANDVANQDKGVAIARQELPSATPAEPTISSEEQQKGIKIDREAIKPPKSKSKEASPATSSSSISKDKKKKKKGKGDALSSLFGSLS